MIYEKITTEDWDYKRSTPACPDKGAFEVSCHGETYFMLDGNLHREDGPAWIWANGTQKYYQNDKLHRVDGPAWIFPDGSEYYYLFDQRYSKENWELKVIQLSLKDQII